MSEADRRHPLSNVDAGADAELSSSRENRLSDGFADAFAGVRALNLPVTNSRAYDEQLSRGTGKAGHSSVRAIAPLAGVFGLAAIARLVVLLFVTGPGYAGVGWYMDALHHWQISYLSKEIGFLNGFLQLWDFKGMEYFWGAAHPLATAGLFALTGSIDVLVPRLLGLATGSLAVLFLYLLVRRHFGTPAALAAAAFMALNPVIIVADTAGIQEPIGLMFLLGALYFWPRQAIWAGVLLGLAGTVRAEYWVFGLGICIVSFIVDRREYKNLALLLGWAIPSLAYMKYLLTYTGNPIYPVYWYFLGDAVGEWMGNEPLGPIEIGAIWVSRLLLPVFALAAVAIIRRRPRYSLFALLGLGELIFLCIVFGFTVFISGFSYRILFDRIFMIPHIFLGVIVGVILLYALQKPSGFRIPKWGAAAAAGLFIVSSQILWLGVWHYHSPWDGFWSDQFESAAEIAELYQGGVVSIPEDRPEYTYFFARYHGIPANSIQGQMYDAFAYFDDDPFADYAKTEPLLRDWLVGNDIRLLVTYSHEFEYQEMIKRSPNWFTSAGSSLEGAIHVYYVHPTGS